jgi:U4/U6.U5 tri-snRNP-associated protein 1
VPFLLFSLKLKRLEKEKAKLRKQKTLGDLDDDEEDTDTLSWVERSRLIEQEKQRAAALQNQLEELDGGSVPVSSSSAPEVKVTHELNELQQIASESNESTTEHVLTLRDQPVLAESDVVELENITLTEQAKTAKYNEWRKGKKSYDVFDDTNQPILAKYDDEKPIEGVKLRLETGQIVPSSTTSPSETKPSAPSAQTYTLEVTKTQANEYYSHEELDAFKKQIQEAHKVHANSFERERERERSHNQKGFISGMLL